MGSKPSTGALPFSALSIPEQLVSDLFLPVLIMAVPVMVIVLLALVSGRKLSGSCGGVGPDGACTRCGKPADQIAADRRSGEACP